MARFVVLIDWTEKGVANFQASVDRYEATRQQFEGIGVRFEQIYWTLGSHDIVSVVVRTLPAELIFSSAAASVSPSGASTTLTMS